ncbi:GNAT family N-acetyltransferase [Vibrio fluvialis]
MEIKVAEYSDFERIAHLHALSWQINYADILDKDYLANEALQDRLLIWQTRLTNPPFNQHILLIEEGSVLCGFICAFGNHDFEKGTIIESLHIDPKHQGSGLGRLLVKEMATWIERYFPDNGVYLEVLEKNQQAIDFYDHIGGELLTEKMWHAPGGVDVPERVYSWKTPKALMAAME